MSQSISLWNDIGRYSDELHRRYGSTYQGIIEEKLIGDIDRSEVLQSYNQEVFESEVNMLGLWHQTSNAHITGSIYYVK